jgi:hypothetical protein
MGQAVKVVRLVQTDQVAPADHLVQVEVLVEVV